MILGKVTGNIVASVKHPAYVGHKIMCVVPIDEHGKEAGPDFIAVDNAQAGVGDTVLVLKEGTGVRQILVGDSSATLPILETIVGIVDQVHVPGDDA